MADGKFGMKSGTEYLPKYNWSPGMNDELQYSDRAGYTTSMEMLTGGVPEDWDMFSGPEVGNQYDLDPMSEERSMTTFSQTDPMAKGMIGMMATEGAPMQEGETRLEGPGGKKVNLSSPQTYNRVDSPNNKNR